MCVCVCVCVCVRACVRACVRSCVRACVRVCRYGWCLMRSNIPTQASSEVCACLACLLTSNAIKTIFLDRIFSQKDFLSIPMRTPSYEF